ncbi:MAG: TlpA disulfide reductase family protein [Pseudomonadota bacterium]
MLARALRQFDFRWYHLGIVAGAGAAVVAAFLLMTPKAMETMTFPIDDGLDRFTLENRGFPPPLAPIEATDGSRGNLSAFTGKVTLVYFWASWCLPCIVEIPTLEGLQARFPQTEFEVITVSVDREGWPAIAEFNERHDMRLPVYLDPSGPNLSQFEYLSLPTSILLDRDGVEIGRQIGPALWDRDRGVHLIERALDGRL